MQSELLALSSAVALALGSMFMGEVKGRIDALSLTRWSMVVATLMTGTAALVVGGWGTITPQSFVYLAISGFFAITVAGPGYYGGLFSIGPRNTLLIFSLNAPIAAIAGFLLFGERFALKELAALVLILSGVALAVVFGERRPKPEKRFRPVGARGAVELDDPVRMRHGMSWSGIALAFMAALGQGIANVAAKPAMADAVEPFAAMAVRAAVGGILLFPLILLPIRALRPTGRADGMVLSLIVVGTAISMGVGMTMLMGALAEGEVGIVSTLGAMTPVAVLPMVWVRTGKAPPFPAWIGALLAVAGTAVLFMSGCVGEVCI